MKNIVTIILVLLIFKGLQGQEKINLELQNNNLNYFEPLSMLLESNYLDKIKLGISNKTTFFEIKKTNHSEWEEVENTNVVFVSKHISHSVGKDKKKYKIWYLPKKDISCSNFEIRIKVFDLKNNAFIYSNKIWIQRIKGDRKTRKVAKILGKENNSQFLFKPIFTEGIKWIPYGNIMSKPVFQENQDWLRIAEKISKKYPKTEYAQWAKFYQAYWHYYYYHINTIKTKKNKESLLTAKRLLLELSNDTRSQLFIKLKKCFLKYF